MGGKEKRKRRGRRKTRRRMGKRKRRKRTEGGGSGEKDKGGMRSEGGEKRDVVMSYMHLNTNFEVLTSL